MKKIVFLIIIMISALMFSQSVYAEWIYTTLNYDDETHTYSAEEINITVNGEKIENYNMIPILFEGRTLVCARDVFTNIGAAIAWDAANKVVIAEKDGKTVKLKINSYDIDVDGNIVKTDFPPKIVNDYTMLPLRAVSEAFGCGVEWDNEKRMIYINNAVEESFSYKPEHADETTTEAMTEAVTESTTVTTTVTVAESTAVQTTQETTAAPQPSQSTGRNGSGITILWDYMYDKYSNNVDSKRKYINNLDVLCPTWFVLTDGNGTVIEKAGHSYEKWAHENGYKVWALMTNSFDAGITHSTLSNYDARMKMINSVISYANEYNVDGINIDFENLGKTDGDLYVQFIRELTERAKQNGLTVSVDMYVPTVWTEHYQMSEVGKIVDYVCIMAYDEHYSTSPESGSVSSMPWVDKYMAAASEKVASSKLIMGVPFYTRKWIEDSEGNVLNAPSMKMNEPWELAEEYDLQPVWDDECGQYYLKYYSGGLTYRIWIEDKRSMEERMKIAKKYNAAGIAAWQRGFETDDVWDVIGSYY
ncbi:MAG: hypothetical protein IJ736_00530 [Firmicutes bacterium]|nr:hypothetical protein [Bacillota bacterium]